MKKLAGLLAAAAFMALPAQAAEITGDDFKAEDVASIVKLCSSAEGVAMSQYATGFCYGWIAGIDQFYDALVADPRFGISPSVCVDDEVSREEARKIFLEWATSNPSSASMPALSGLIEAMKAKFPC
ncbi:MAG: hypothetical protein Kilf2KO_27870 [Rhodospirillales bacterium]